MVTPQNTWKLIPTVLKKMYLVNTRKNDWFLLCREKIYYFML